jgi:hypothetical protein
MFESSRSSMRAPSRCSRKEQRKLSSSLSQEFKSITRARLVAEPSLLRTSVQETRKCRVRFDAFPLGDVFDDFNEFVDAVAVVAGESDELPRALDNRASFRCARDRDATPAPELEESLVAEHP